MSSSTGRTGMTRSAGSMSTTPFQAIFGRQAITLTALEQPQLLPSSTEEEKDVKKLAVTIKRLQSRLQKESDLIKQAALAAERKRQTTTPGTRTVQKGDYVWLVYSDKERARYRRKHGHGKAWKHAFVVEEVRPNAVRLLIPKDGSVPDVLHWQSLRKCTFAPPHFHDDNMPTPELDHLGLPIVPSDEDENQESEKTPDPEGWHRWSEDPNQLFEIEQIMSAERVGSGWRIWVKWKGYPSATPEPLFKLMRYVTDPAIADQISQRQEEYEAKNPTEFVPLDRSAYEPAKPTRVQPTRQRNKSERTTFAVQGVNVPVMDLVRSTDALNQFVMEAEEMTKIICLNSPETMLTELDIVPVEEPL